MTTTAAIFDFDGTLIKGDSLPHFIAAAVGWRRCLEGLAKAMLRPLPGQPDRKTGIKAAWLQHTLADLPLTEAARAAAHVKARLRWKADIRDALLKHKADGTTIIVATGALDVYIHTLLEGLPVDKVMCTEMERVNGHLTGRLLAGNCVRHEKARRVGAWLKDNNIRTSYGYGNAPSDIPFLACTNFPKIV